MDPERFRGFSTPELTPKDNLSILPPAPPHKYSSRPKAKSEHKLGLIIAFIIFLIAVAGSLTLLFLTHHKKAPSKTQTTSQAPTNNTAPAAAPQQIATTSYTTTNYNASFNYPSTWTVSDSGNAPLTVTSPVLQLKNANGSNVLGQIVLSLSSKGTLPQQFGTQAVAVITSQKISYTQPSPNQAAQSYISFVQYSTTVARGGLDAIYLSGNFGYQQDQTIPASDLSTVDPLTYISFYSCANAQCPLTSRQPLTIDSAVWSDSTFSAPLLLMLKSFTFD